MSTNTALLGLGKAVAADATQTYLSTTLAANMDTLDNAVLLASVQTLTNKTLTSPTLTSPTISSGGLAVTAGNAAINGSIIATTGLVIQGTMSGAVTERGVLVNHTYDSSATTLGSGLRIADATAAASFTLSNRRAIEINDISKGSGSSVTTNVGLYVAPQTGGSSDNIGIDILPPSGGTNNYALRTNNGAGITIGGNAIRSGTTPTNQIDIFNGTAPVGTLSNGATLYAASGELRVMDAAGNSTLLSPHDDDGFWVYDSTSPLTGKHLRIDIERLLKAVNDAMGLDCVHEAAL